MDSLWLGVVLTSQDLHVANVVVDADVVLASSEPAANMARFARRQVLSIAWGRLPPCLVMLDSPVGGGRKMSGMTIGQLAARTGLSVSMRPIYERLLRP